MRRSNFGFHFIPTQNRSTAKCRLAQTLAITKTAWRHIRHHRNPDLRKFQFATGNEILKQPSLLDFAFVHEWVNNSNVSCWLALRASVLRRAASLSGTAQERRAEITAVVVSPASQGASPKWKSNVPTIVRSANQPKSVGRSSPNPQEKHLRLAGLAGPMVLAYHMGSFSLISAG